MKIFWEGREARFDVQAEGSIRELAKLVIVVESMHKSNRKWPDFDGILASFIP